MEKKEDLMFDVTDIVQRAKLALDLKKDSVTLYDVTAAANLKTLLADGPQYVLGKIQIPNIPRCDGAVYISGDSMYPILKSGDIVGFKSLTSFDEVIYGEMYLVSFDRGGDEYLSVKYVPSTRWPSSSSPSARI